MKRATRSGADCISAISLLMLAVLVVPSMAKAKTYNASATQS